mgnify:CR=1 FL=1
MNNENEVMEKAPVLTKKDCVERCHPLVFNGSNNL